MLQPSKLLFTLLWLCLHDPATMATSSCWSDVPGSYGDPRQTEGLSFAPLIGVACSGQCYFKASRWSRMAVAHGNRPVPDVATCRALCAATFGCQVFTYDHGALSCRAMRSLIASPTLAQIPNTTTGKPGCNDNTTHIFPFPDSLSTFLPSDVDDPCFRPGYLYGDGDAQDPACSSPPPRRSIACLCFFIL